MTDQTIPYDTTRCTGKFVGQHGEFGVTLHPQCVGCMRRTKGDPEYQWYMAAPEFEHTCESRVYKDGP